MKVEEGPAGGRCRPALIQLDKARGERLTRTRPVGQGVFTTQRSATAPRNSRHTAASRLSGGLYTNATGYQGDSCATHLHRRTSVLILWPTGGCTHHENACRGRQAIDLASLHRRDGAICRVFAGLMLTQTNKQTASLSQKSRCL
ncbi:unnamed protein product [Ectocarpus sp. 12 AP-2014]